MIANSPKAGEGEFVCCTRTGKSRAVPRDWGLAMESPPGPEVLLEGRRYLYFGGTSYYCLHGHPGLLDAARSALMKYGIGPATGSAAPVGDSRLIRNLEKKTADFFGAEAAVTIPSGYLSTMVGITALADGYDRIFMDEHTHFSGVDAVRITGKPCHRFRHLDHEDLRKMLKKHLRGPEKPLLVSDGVFPAYGAIAPADKYAEALEPYGGLMWLDDAHAAGVIGPNFRGTYDYYGLRSDRFYFGATYAKAFGGFGGFIPGNRRFVDHIKAGSHVVKGASRIGAASSAAACFGLDFIANNPPKARRLAENARYCKQGLAGLGIELADSPFPVAAFGLEDREKTAWLHGKLLERGIAVQFLNYIGGPPEGMLRIVIFSEHTEKQIRQLLENIEELLFEI